MAGIQALDPSSPSFKEDAKEIIGRFAQQARQKADEMATDADEHSIEGLTAGFFKIQAEFAPQLHDNVDGYREQGDDDASIKGRCLGFLGALADGTDDRLVEWERRSGRRAAL